MVYGLFLNLSKNNGWVKNKNSRVIILKNSWHLLRNIKFPERKKMITRTVSGIYITYSTATVKFSQTYGIW